MLSLLMILLVIILIAFGNFWKLKVNRKSDIGFHKTIAIGE